MSEEKRSRTAIDAPRGTHFNIEPERLVLVEDKEHPLYDVRVHLAPDENMVRSVMAHGVVETIVARKNGDAVEVIDGRQRVKAAIEANKRFAAEGASARVRVPTILRNEDTDADDAVLMVLTNEIRRDDDIVTKAGKAKHLADFGKTPQEIALAFGVAPATIKAWLRVHELAGIVKAAIRDGQIGAGEAVAALADLPKNEQSVALAKLVETSGMSRRGAKRQPGAAKRATPMARLRALARADADVFTRREQLLIAWVFGKLSRGDLLTVIPAAHCATKGVR